MTEAANLARLSAAATQGEATVSNDEADAWNMGSGKNIALKFGDTVIACNTTYYPTEIEEDDAEFIAALVTAYRSGRLVLLPSVGDTSRAIHEYLSRRDIMQYLDNEEDCGGLATAIHSHLKGTGDA